MNTNTEVIEFDSQNTTNPFSTITILCSDEKKFEITLHEFEAYLQRNDKLDFFHAFPGADGEPVERSGTLTISEYFDQTSIEEISFDLKCYLQSREIVENIMFGIRKTVEGFYNAKS